MLLWLLPLVTGVGFFALRSWQQDVAIRSGELMDVRDVHPEGLVDLEVRALAAKRYRLELQFESSTRLAATSESAARKKKPAFAKFPYQLSITALAEEDDDSVPVYESHRDLQDLLVLSAAPRETVGMSQTGEQRIDVSGSVPLVEFESQSLGRMRFEFSMDLREEGEIEGQRYEAQLDKAWLVLKEEVRPLRAPSALLDTIHLDLRSLSRLIGG